MIEVNQTDHEDLQTLQWHELMSEEEYIASHIKECQGRLRFCLLHGLEEAEYIRALEDHFLAVSRHIAIRREWIRRREENFANLENE